MLSYPIPAGTKLIDKRTNGQSLSWYQSLLGSGVHGVILDMMTGDVQPDIQNALTAGLTVLLFQGYDTAMFAIPSQATTRANLMVKAAKTAGFPAGSHACNLALDLEATGSASASAIYTWATNWGETVRQAGYQPALYVGPGQPLSGQQLYDLPPFAHYWRSAANVPAVATRGYEILQTAFNQVFEGVYVDYNLVQADALGSLPVGVMLQPGPNAATFAALQQQVATLQAALTTLHREGQHTAQTVATMQAQLTALTNTVTGQQDLLTALKMAFQKG